MIRGAGYSDNNYNNKEIKTMLVLSRKTNEKIRIGNDITITIVRVHGKTVVVGIDAPKDLAITRIEKEREAA